MSALLLLEKYQLAERLGPQGAIETYGALMKVNGQQRPCIVKWLRADRVPRETYPSVAARFMAAAQRLSARHDASWPVVFDVTQNQQGAFLIREFVASVDLHGLLQAAREKNPAATLDPAVASLVVSKLAQVVNKAHEAEPPLCHLGLSPANVLVTPDGRVVVADFGLLASVRGLVEHGLDRWTFVAPELIGTDLENLPLSAGVAADLYSLGGLLYYLLSSHPPVEVRSLTELSERAWEPLPALPGIPEHLNAAIAALTAPDPQNRCKSVKEAAAYLSSAPKVSAPAPVTIKQVPPDGLPFHSASQPAPVPRPQRALTSPISRIDRPRSARLLTALAGLLLIFAGGLALRSYSVHVRPREAPKTGIKPSAETTPQALGTDVSGSAPPVMPARLRRQKLVPGHLDVTTFPPNADLWVDGMWQGKTPLDVVPGPGAHRVVIVAAGHQMFKGVYDTTDGEFIQRTLDSISPPVRGSAHLDIHCQAEGRYPVLIDGLETGLLCPANMVPVVPGRREIAIFVPALQDSVVQEVAVSPESKPMVVRFPQ